jgi:hypothetical protein
MKKFWTQFGIVIAGVLFVLMIVPWAADNKPAPPDKAALQTKLDDALKTKQLIDLQVENAQLKQQIIATNLNNVVAEIQGAGFKITLATAPDGSQKYVVEAPPPPKEAKALEAKDPPKK